MYFLGIDAGGSKTSLALGDEAQVYARAQTGSIKLGRVTESEAREHLRAGVREVCASGAVGEEEILRCCIGFSGASRPDLVADVDAMARELLPNARLRIVGDHLVAHRAAFADGVGVLTIAGTGSICYGRNDAGAEARAGGYGPVISDQGSGSWIGREAVQRSLRAHDTGQDSALLAAVLEKWKLADIAALISHAGQVAPAEFAALFPVVLQAAKAKDELALALLRDAATQLTEHTSVVSRRLGCFEIALVGGVAESSEYLRECFAEEIRKRLPRSRVQEVAMSPAEGALRLAREA